MADTRATFDPSNMRAASGRALVNPRVMRGQRDHARARLDVPARLLTMEGTVPCMAIDASCCGAKLSAETAPRVGTMVVVQGLPHELFGDVRWSSRGRFGIAFDEPLPLAQVIALRRYAEGEGARQREAVLSTVRTWVTGQQ